MRALIFTHFSMPNIRTHHSKLAQFDFPNEQTSELFRIIRSLETEAECEAFFRDLWTLSEMKSMSERWQIAKLIWQGFPYRMIIKELNVSSTTIARVSHWMQYGNGGFRRMCQKLVRHPSEEELKLRELKLVMREISPLHI